MSAAPPGANGPPLRPPPSMDGGRGGDGSEGGDGGDGDTSAAKISSSATVRAPAPACTTVTKLPCIPDAQSAFKTPRNRLGGEGGEVNGADGGSRGGELDGRRGGGGGGCGTQRCC